MFGTGKELGEEVHDGVPGQILGTHHHVVVFAGLSGVVLSPWLLPLHPDGANAFDLVYNKTTNNNSLYFSIYQIGLLLRNEHIKQECMKNDHIKQECMKLYYDYNCKAL